MHIRSQGKCIIYCHSHGVVCTDFYIFRSMMLHNFACCSFVHSQRHHRRHRDEIFNLMWTTKFRQTEVLTGCSIENFKNSFKSAVLQVFNWHVRHVNGNERKFSITEEHVRCVITNEVMHTPFLPSIIGKYFTHRHRRHLQMLPVEFSWETFSLASSGAENWWTRQKSNSERHRRGRFSHTKRKSQRGNCIINRERQKEDHVI